MKIILTVDNSATEPDKKTNRTQPKYYKIAKFIYIIMHALLLVFVCTGMLAAASDCKIFMFFTFFSMGFNHLIISFNQVVIFFH